MDFKVAFSGFFSLMCCNKVSSFLIKRKLLIDSQPEAFSSEHVFIFKTCLCGLHGFISVCTSFSQQTDQPTLIEEKDRKKEINEFSKKRLTGFWSLIALMFILEHFCHCNTATYLHANQAKLLISNKQCFKEV